MLITSVLSCEEAFGAVTRILVPPGRVAEATQELEALARLDLAALVEAGQPGHLIVTAGGVDWPFGGL